jgi:hypothetical protein
VLQPNSDTPVGDVANVARAQASVAAKKQKPALAAESSLAGSAVEDLVAVGHSTIQKISEKPAQPTLRKAHYLATKHAR